MESATPVKLEESDRIKPIEHEAERPVLTASDRCDGSDCNARAFYRCVFKTGAQLLFCRHDFLEKEASLRVSAVIVDDYSHLCR